MSCLLHIPSSSQIQWAACYTYHHLHSFVVNELLASQKCNGKSRLACADVRHPLSSKTPVGILSWTYWMMESREITEQMTGRQLNKACPPPPSSHTHTLKQPPPPTCPSLSTHSVAHRLTRTQSLTLPLPLALSRILSVSQSHWHSNTVDTIYELGQSKGGSFNSVNTKQTTLSCFGVIICVGRHSGLYQYKRPRL